MGKTLYDKIWDAHLVEQKPGEAPVLYIDRHLVHEVTSPQAFEGLRNNGRKVRRPELTLAVADHNVPTKDRDQGITDPESPRAGRDPGEERHAISASNISPWTISARASCTSSVRNRAGPCPAPPSSAATATPRPMAPSARWPSASAPRKSSMCWRPRPCGRSQSKNMRVTVNGKLPDGVTAKDIALAVIAKIGTAGGTGYVIEYAGEAVRALSMEGRMTLCNLTIEGGARAGLVAVDDTTIDYIKGRPRAPKAAAFEAAAHYWRTLKSDPDAKFDAEVVLDARDIVPMVTWGTSPEQALPITGQCARSRQDEGRASARRRRARAGLYGPDRQHEAHRHQGGSCLHRLLHQWPHRGSARRRRHRARARRWPPASTPSSCRARAW